jgi:uncharacterized membrane protein YdjX (TVP38/TMEM64 family)
MAGGVGLIRAAESLTGRGHSLRPIDDGEPDPKEMARYIEGLADPERPVAVADLISGEMRARVPRVRFSSLGKLAAGLLLVLALTLAWNLTPLSNLLDAAAIEAGMAAFAASAWAPAYVLAAFLLGGLVAFPVTLLIAGTAAAFGPLLGFTYAAVGSLASALLTYAIGAWLGRRTLQGALGPRLGRIRARVCRSGILAIAAIRLVPAAPFTVVNMVAGACGIALADYMIGTAIGLLPGLLIMSAMGYQIFRFVTDPDPASFLLLAGVFALWLMAVVAAQSLVARARARSGGP